MRYKSLRSCSAASIAAAFDELLVCGQLHEIVDDLCSSIFDVCEMIAGIRI